MNFISALPRGLLVGLLAVPLVSANVSAAAICGLCANEVVMNSELATCFLDQYDDIAKATGEAVAVDLSGCASRGVVEALPTPNAPGLEPDTQFIVSHDQLACLKKKLEQPGLVLDPSTKIELDSCG